MKKHCNFEAFSAASEVSNSTWVGSEVISEQKNPRGETDAHVVSIPSLAIDHDII
jgi:hypothetical protein